MLQLLKSVVLPDRPVPCRLLLGPFRGARVILNPQISLRYIFGIYEHELNGWISAAVGRVNRVFDVGANHGYFAFGVMAAWRRTGRNGLAWAFEPAERECLTMQRAAPWNEVNGTRLAIEHCFVSDSESPNIVTLDAFSARRGLSPDEGCTLIKVDVEGFEMNVLRGAQQWIRPGTLFLVEVHSEALLHEVTAFFSERKHAIKVVAPRSIRLFGTERRSLSTCWVVSDLEKA
jgi:hypothetical protein